MGLGDLNSKRTDKTKNEKGYNYIIIDINTFLYSSWEIWNVLHHCCLRETIGRNVVTSEIYPRWSERRGH